MSVFVAGIQPESSAAHDGKIMVGDELLEVMLLSINLKTRSQKKFHSWHISLLHGCSPLTLFPCTQKQGQLSVYLWLLFDTFI